MRWPIASPRTRHSSTPTWTSANGCRRSWDGTAPPLPRADPEPGRASADGRLYRELRHHHVRSRPGHGADVSGRLPARPSLGLSIHQPPTELANYLLGPDQPWQLADANWSPDFPTSARDALRLYTNESGDDRIDGVLGITTYTIDELLEVTGPIAVPEYGATIASGRDDAQDAPADAGRRAGREPKGVPVDVRRPTVRRPAQPSAARSGPRSSARRTRSASSASSWHGSRIRDDQALVSRRRLRRRGSPGSRRLRLPRRFQRRPGLEDQRHRHAQPAARRDDRSGRQRPEHARRDLGQPDRDAASASRTARFPTLEGLRILGMYFRLLAREGQPIEFGVGRKPRQADGAGFRRQGGGSDRCSARISWCRPARRRFATSGRRRRRSPSDETRRAYRLTIQKQPGLLPGPLTVTIRVPDGFGSRRRRRLCRCPAIRPR